MSDAAPCDETAVDPRNRWRATRAHEDGWTRHLPDGAHRAEEIDAHTKGN